MDKDQLTGLITLKAVAEYKSFSRAAEALKITHSAVSQIIKNLEEKVGITLISRTTRNLNLTEAGERFLSNIGPAIDQVINAFEDISTYAKKPSGQLRINCPTAVYWNYLLPILSSFNRKYPEITVEVCIQDAQSNIVEGGFDAGIRLSDILAKDMVAMKLYGPVLHLAAASPKYLKKVGIPKHPRDLLSYNCITGRIGNHVYNDWEFEEKGSEFQVQVKGNLILNEPNALIKAAVEGNGIVYADELSIRQFESSGKLEIILEKYAAKSAGYYLYYPKSSQVLPKLRAFIDHIKELRK